MPATLVSGPVCAAVIAALQGSTAITAIVPASRITDQAPSSNQIIYPLILVEGHGELPNNTLGAPDATAFGSSVMVGVRVVSNYRGDAETNNLGSLIRGVLDGLKLTISPFLGDVLTYEGKAPIFQTLVGGIPIREQVSEYDLTVHQ